MADNYDHVFKTSVDKGVTVMDVMVSLDAVSVEDITRGVDALLKAGNKRILVDLTHSRRIDSSGFGAMVAIQVLARNRLSYLAFTGIDNNQMKTMKLLRLNEQLEVRNDRQEAVEALSRKGMAPMEKTLIILKPDAVQRHLAGEIISRFERRGLKIAGLKLMSVSTELAKEHYAEHQGKPFYDSLVEFITSSPVVVAALEGENAVALVRNMIGALDPAQALAGTIRGDYTSSRQKNLIHGSDSAQSAERELALWFKPEDLVSWEKTIKPWLV